MFTNHGSLWTVLPTTRAARTHLVASVSAEALWSGRALVVEPRYVGGLVDGLQADGFTIGAGR